MILSRVNPLPTQQPLTMYSPTRLPIIMYALVLLTYVTFTIAASDDCFKQQGGLYTRLADGGRRISAGIACPDSVTADCPLPWGGYLNAPSILNVTTRDDAKVFAAVGKVADKTLPKSIYGTVGNGTYFVDPGQIGWYAYTVAYVCRPGLLLEDCAADLGVPNDTAIEACYANMFAGDTTDGIPQFAGQGSFVGTNIENIANMTSNPAANTTSTSRAVQLAAGNGLLMIFLTTIMGLAGWLLF